jgi:serine/threonine protein phosphatase PrpC
MILDVYAKTHVGRIRAGNEDNFLLLDLSTLRAWTGTDGEEPPAEMCRVVLGPKGYVMVVSDGMGGALAGDVASRMAVETVRDMLTGVEDGDEEGEGAEASLAESLRNATDYANFAIHRKSQDDPRCNGMGATLTGAAVNGDGLSFVQVGDSRGYVIRGSRIHLATKDQSLVQQLVDVGQISEQEAETHMFRNVILQALGAQPELSPVSGRVRLFRDDLVLLCSDGLSGKLRAEDMLNIIAESDGDLARACAELVAEANARGGEDNITVVLARLTGEDLPSPDSEGGITVEPTTPEGEDSFNRDDDTTENLREI